VVPLEASPRTLSITGCADFALALVEAPAAPAAAGEGAGVAVEVRRDAEVEVDLIVRVDSSRNLQPSGFTATLGHDPELFVLEAAEFREPFVQGFVKADGFTRVEISSTGVVAVVLSSVASPVGLSPGSHPAVRTTYRFPARGRPGDVFPTRIGLSEDLELDGSPARSVFQPGNARPCTTASLDIDLVVGPDYWIRGDTNADGLVDLSDGIHLLSHLFLGTDGNCVRAMETNSDGRVDLSDAVLLLNHLFLGGRAPLAPFPDCGAAEDSLPCAIFPCPA
jgi:hypothetical protein